MMEKYRQFVLFSQEPENQENQENQEKQKNKFNQEREDMNMELDDTIRKSTTETISEIT